MAHVLGVNAVFHDPAAALVVDGEIVAATEEERFSRRKHGKAPVPFSTWELPEQAATWCLQRAGIGAEDLDAVAYSYDPGLAPPPGADITAEGWEGLRTLYAARAPRFLQSVLGASTRRRSASFPTMSPTPPRRRWPPRCPRAACSSSTAGARSPRTLPAGATAAS